VITDLTVIIIVHHVINDIPSLHPQNDLESQPLAYLYFLTVLEHLFHQHNDLSNLLNVALEVGTPCVLAFESPLNEYLSYRYMKMDLKKGVNRY